MKAQVSWLPCGIKPGSGFWLGLNCWHFSCWLTAPFHCIAFYRHPSYHHENLSKKCQAETIIQMLNSCGDLVRSLLKWIQQWLKFKDVWGCGCAPSMMIIAFFLIDDASRLYKYAFWKCSLLCQWIMHLLNFVSSCLSSSGVTTPEWVLLLIPLHCPRVTKQPDTNPTQLYPWLWIICPTKSSH